MVKRVVLRPEEAVVVLGKISQSFIYILKSDTAIYKLHYISITKQWFFALLECSRGHSNGYFDTAELAIEDAMRYGTIYEVSNVIELANLIIELKAKG